ncbi:HVA22-like protein j [Hibiscus syriacus]|uniref:HVA22-like protein n=2 Tax=Hibiscus syriacus TaxID=106335 RepID=A0A6A2WG14_HIBSY|nr:HVA22-like protein j [Hibiscus syriacus]
MYGEMKVGMLVYLWYPKTKGTGYVYDTLLRPFMARHETEVDRKIQEIKARIWDFIFKYCQHFAVMGQGKFFEMLQYMANQSLKFKQANQKSDDPSTPNGHRDSPRMRSRPVQT